MSNLKKIIDLIKKTGGKYIISDEFGEPSCVVLSIDDYEHILAKNGNDYSDVYRGKIKSLTDLEMLDKINVDIAFWKESRENEELDSLVEDLAKNTEGNEDYSNELDEEDRYYLEPID